MIITKGMDFADENEQIHPNQMDLSEIMFNYLSQI